MHDVRHADVRTETLRQVRKLYEYHESPKTRPDAAEYSKILRSLMANFSHTYIIVDALDECNESDGTRSKLMKELQQSPANLSLLCTSRLLGDIEKRFATASRLEILARDTDVEAYVQARISEESSLAEFCEKDKNLRSTIIKRLVEKAKGMSVCL